MTSSLPDVSTYDEARAHADTLPPLERGHWDRGAQLSLLTWAQLGSGECAARTILVQIGMLDSLPEGCVASVATIAELTGLGVSTVRKHLPRLHAAGLIYVRHCTRKGSRATGCNQITVDYDRLATFCPRRKKGRGAPSDRGGALHEVEGGAPSDRGGGSTTWSHGAPPDRANRRREKKKSTCAAGAREDSPDGGRENPKPTDHDKQARAIVACYPDSQGKSKAETILARKLAEGVCTAAEAMEAVERFAARKQNFWPRADRWVRGDGLHDELVAIRAARAKRDQAEQRRVERERRESAQEKATRERAEREAQERTRLTVWLETLPGHMSARLVNVVMDHFRQSHNTFVLQQLTRSRGEISKTIIPVMTALHSMLEIPEGDQLPENLTAACERAGIFQEVVA